jgi:hypothetical protein
MMDIARLLFGDDAGNLLDLFGGGEGDGSGMADRVRRAGEWCGSTPGHDSAAGAAGRAAGARRVERQVIIREFRDK